MSELEKDRPAEYSEKLFSVRDELDRLTRRYVDSLLASAHAAEEQAAALSSILEAMADPVLVFDQDMRVILANQAAVQLTGFDLRNMTRSEFRSKHRFFHYPGGAELAEVDEPVVVAMREKRNVELEGQVTGEHLPPKGLFVRVHASPILNAEGSVVGVVGVYQNITERVRLQHQRDALGSLITHDLKNHLGAESVFLDMMLSGMVGTFDTEDKRMIVRLKEDNKKFIELSTTLLELYRAETFAIECAAVDVVAILRMSCDLNAHEAELAEVKLVVNAEPHLPKISGIGTAWRQILHNLVQNAVSVSTAGQSVQINAKSTGDGVLLEVIDSGPGISADNVRSLFLPSAKENYRTTNSTGFGLYLCGLLIAAQGGRISCRSKIGEGTVFEIYAPIAT